MNSMEPTLTRFRLRLDTETVGESIDRTDRHAGRCRKVEDEESCSCRLRIATTDAFRGLLRYPHVLGRTGG